VLSGAGYVVRDSAISSLKAELASMRTTEKDLRQQVERMSLLAVRARHADEWQRNSMNWIAHLDAVTAAMPERSRARADEITGSVASAVVFELGADKSTLKAKWTPRRRAVIRLTGGQDDQRSVAEMRQRLLTGQVYEVESSGPDKADRFGLDLVTGSTSPATAPGPTSASGAVTEPATKPAPNPGESK